MITELITTFNELGWAANALAIGTPAAGGAALLYKKRKSLFKSSSFEKTVSENQLLRTWKVGDVIDIAKVAVVDDEPEDFPISELKGAGFTIKGYRQVKLADVVDISKFDVVFLDMYGIVKDDPTHGGLRLISELRAMNPGQKICAVSNKTFDPTATEFFRNADEVQKKPLAAQKCQELLRTLLNEKFNPNILGRQIDLNLISCLSDRKKALSFATAYRDSQQSLEQLTVNLAQLSMPLRDQLLVVDFARVFRHATK